MATGDSDAEIAQRLGVNALTVRFHVSNLLVKLGLNERQEAVILAKQRGLVAGAARS
jgi:DNA-binding NarL/FixJ family response regulator